MTSDNLENLASIGKLKRERTSQSEFDGLVQSGRRRLMDARVTNLSLEGRFDLAYNASHALSLAALRWHGYRSDYRYLVFQCLPFTLGMEPAQWRLSRAADLFAVPENGGGRFISLGIILAG